MLLDVSASLYALVLEGSLLFDDSAEEELHLQVSSLGVCLPVTWNRVYVKGEERKRPGYKEAAHNPCTCVCSGAGQLHPGERREPAGRQGGRTLSWCSNNHTARPS